MFTFRNIISSFAVFISKQSIIPFYSERDVTRHVNKAVDGKQIRELQPKKKLVSTSSCPKSDLNVMFRPSLTILIFFREHRNNKRRKCKMRVCSRVSMENDHACRPRPSNAGFGFGSRGESISHYSILVRK